MLKITDRIAHHTPEQIEDYVRETVRIADACGLETDDRIALLPQILGLVSTHQLTIEQMQLGAGAMAIPRNSH